MSAHRPTGRKSLLEYRGSQPNLYEIQNDKRLTAFERDIANKIVERIKRGAGVCHDTNIWFAKACSCSEATVERAITHLRKLKLIETKTRQKTYKHKIRSIFIPRKGKAVNPSPVKQGRVEPERASASIKEDNNIPAKPLPARSGGESSPHQTVFSVESDPPKMRYYMDKEKDNNIPAEQGRE